MQLVTIILSSIIVILVIALVVVSVIAFRKEPCHQSQCSLVYKYPSFPDTEFLGQNMLYTDTHSLSLAQARCSADQNCASFVTHDSTNYYYPSSAQIYRVSGPGTVLYVKQPQCQT